jgi:hypothetical protein
MPAAKFGSCDVKISDEPWPQTLVLCPGGGVAWKGKHQLVLCVISSNMNGSEGCVLTGWNLFVCLQKAPIDPFTKERCRPSASQGVPLGGMGCVPLCLYLCFSELHTSMHYRGICPFISRLFLQEW